MENWGYFYENQENSWEIRNLGKIVEIYSLLKKSEEYANFFEKIRVNFSRNSKMRENFDETSNNSRKILRNFREFGKFFRKLQNLRNLSS